MPNIFRLKQLNHFEQIAITKHANERLKERKITADDIVNCISNGKSSNNTKMISHYRVA